jgi:Family of unknown function (DUF5678)
MKVADKIQAEELLGRQLRRYAGRWVAVIDYAVVQDAPTWDELLERLNEEQRERAELFYVSEHPDAINLY